MSPQAGMKQPPDHDDEYLPETGQTKGGRCRVGGSARTLSAWLRSLAQQALRLGLGVAIIGGGAYLFRDDWIWVASSILIGLRVLWLAPLNAGSDLSLRQRISS